MALFTTLSEHLSQPRLLGFGALLAWLVLFHLLVNVWLLCIFTSFLVVLGGWLGSRAILDANSLLHLEHFLPLGKLNLPVYSPENEWRLNHEIHSAAHKAVRDFVSSWYRSVLPEVEGEFERAVLNSMLESVMELKERARRVDRKELIQRLLELYGSHLQSYMTAKQIQCSHKESISLWQVYSEVDDPHPAMGSSFEELSYSKALVNLVLHMLVPYPQMETRTGGYMVTELITCNVLLPLLHRVSDPDWLNQTIVEIFTRSKAPPEMTPLPADALYQCPVPKESWTTCRSLSSSDPPDQASPSSSYFEEQLSPSTLSEDSSQSSLVSIVSSEKSEKLSESLIAPCKANCCPLITGCSNLPKCKVLSMASLIQSDSEDDLMGRYCDCGPPTSFCKAMSLDEDEPFGCFAPLKSLGPKPVVPEDSLWPAGMSPPRKFDLNLDSPNNTPVNILNVHISGTITAKEQRGSSTHLFTVYVVKFDTAESENGASTQKLTSHTVNRRYSEFLNLQTRLEEKPEVKKIIKNIKGPKKIFPDISFSNSDSEKVETRKSQLDTFLKQLNSIPETANSEDMQEFLGLNCDVCTYYGKRPVGKSRIDKMMENALDTLKTAFPYPDTLSPTEDSEVDTDVRITDNRKYRRLTVFQNRMSASLNITDLPPKVIYCFSESSTVLNGMTLTSLENFVKEQEQRIFSQNGKYGQDLCLSSEQFGKGRKASWKTHSTDTAVADVALNIVCLLMKDQWSWLCTENIQKALRLLFGTFIERWLDVGVAHLTSAPCWVIYLQVLQEAVWPGGTLPAQPRPERSAAQREETKEQCLECLLQLIPQLVTDMLGAEKFRLSLETVLESLQDYQINKHLLYCICDLLLELLIPESCDEAFQSSLLLRLGKEPDKDNHHI